MTEETDGNDGNVFLFPKVKPGADAVTPPAERKTRDYHDCRHRRLVQLDKEAHQLRCADCEQVLDCFDWIWDYVGRWDTQNTYYRQAKQQAHDAAKEVTRLERLEKNARARIRRGGLVITSKGARQAYQQMRALGQAVSVYLQYDAVRPPTKVSREQLEARLSMFGYKPEDARAALDELRRITGLEGGEEDELPAVLPAR